MLVARKIVKSRWLSGSIILILACATAAVLIGGVMLDAVLNKKLDVEDPDSLVRIRTSSPSNGVTNPVFRELSRSLESFDDLFHYMPQRQYGIGYEGEDTILDGASVSDSYFDSLGLVPSEGRLIQAADYQGGSSPVIVVSHAVWRTKFGGVADAIGVSVLLNGVPFTLVGVAPRGFHGLDPLSREDFWIPTEHIIDQWQINSRGWPMFVTLGRFADGYNWSAAQQELTLLGARIREEFPDDGPKTDFSLMTQQEWIRAGEGKETVNTISLIFGLVLLLLIVALSNLMALVSTRTESRKTEYATQMAIGASRSQIIRAYLVENLALCLLGWVVGLLVAYAIHAYFVSELLDGILLLDFSDILRPSLLPYLLLMPIIYTIALSLGGMATIYRLVPASVLRGGNKGSRAFAGRRLLVFVQVTLAVVVVSACSWFVNSIKNAESQDFGFESDGLLLIQTNLKLKGTQFAGPHISIPEYRRMKEWIESLPNVETVGMGNLMPLRHSKVSRVVVDGHDRRLHPDENVVRALYVGPDYFKSLGIELLEGRGIRFDDMGYPMTKVVVNKAFADRYWPEQVAIGRVFHPWSGGPEVSVVGVSPSFSQELGQEVLPQMFVGFSELQMVFHVKTSIQPEAFMPSFTRMLMEKETVIPILETMTLQRSFRETFSSMYLSFFTAVLIAALSMLIAASGLFALVRHFIQSSRREIGIRIALGADPSTLLRWILQQCGVPVLLGCSAGIGIAYLLFPYASDLLFEVNRIDPLLVLGVLAVIILVASASMLGPAIRAAYSMPIDSLLGSSE